MNNLNLDILLATPKDTIVKDINQIFNNLLNEIRNYLGLVPISPNVKIIITDDIQEYSNNFFSFGVRRKEENFHSQIKISKKHFKFLKFILLREAYLCFVPLELREKEIIQIVIHEIMENNLSKLEEMEQWKTLIRASFINYDFLIAQFDKMDKFFKLEATEMTQSPTQFFFEFIRRNVSLIQDKMDDLYDTIFKEFIYRTSNSIYNDEILETIRVLVKIFYQIKLFKKFSEFEEYFQEFKEKGMISTNLSKRKFSKNLRWISKNTIISPIFQQIYHKINIAVAISILKFNPILHRKDIYNILDRIPFLHIPAFTKNGFSEEIHCYFVIPGIYLKDLLNLIEQLVNSGYIIKKECYIWKEYNNIINLNYFKENFIDLRKIINPNHKNYDNRFELKFSNSYGEPHKVMDLNLLDWLIFERVGQSSLAGFGFERRTETLQSLKDELLNHIESERVLISNLKSSLSIFYESPQLKKELFDFLEKNKRFGFFYMEDMLQRILTYLDLVEMIIKKNPEIINLVKLQEFLQTHQISQLLEENLLFNRKNIRIIVFRDFIPIYFKSFHDYLMLKIKFGHFHNFYKVCMKLKIFNIDSMKEIINNEKIPEKIYYTKEKKLKQSFEKFKPYKITNQEIDSIFTRFLKKDLIAPELIRTIITSSFAKYHPILLLKDNLDVNCHIEKIIKLFPRVYLERIRNLFNNESIIMIYIYLLNIKEKELFCSILYNLFNENIINFKRYHTSGLVPFVLVKDFYDFDRNVFFYTKDLFEQSYLYIKKILGDSLNPLDQNKTKSQEKFWSKENNIFNLIKEVDKRVSHEQVDFDINRINELVDFSKDLNNILLDPEKFKNYQHAQFFKNFVKSIKFVPNFQAFGLNQFYLYIHPSDVDEIDFKHLLINNFQSIKYPININDTNSFLIKYIFPYGNPNIKHLNWYTKTKRIIREYCLFSTKRIIQILNFNYNLSANGWNYDSNRFKIYMQNILFNPDYKVEFFKIRYLDIGKSTDKSDYRQDSTYFQALSEIYTWRSIDIKSFLGTHNYSIINNIKMLLSKNLIFPYLSLRNLDFQDKVYIILPNVKEELNQIIIDIFNFFNYGLIYEIEGEFYIHGFNEEIKFENGLLIKLYLPQCELDEFLKLFDFLFEYLKIDDYIFLTDLSNGKNLLKEIYGDLSFFNSYNPLLNLKWSNKDKIWMNHKLYTERFEKLYPNLFYGLIKDDNN